MRQVRDFFENCSGKGGLIVLMTAGLVSLGAAFFKIILERKSSPIKFLLSAVILAAGLFLSWQIEIYEERVHIFEYALLGWLAARDLINKNKKSRGFVFAVIFTISIGVVDELFQLFLPYRYYDNRDILFNGLGGMWGVVLYLFNL